MKKYTELENKLIMEAIPEEGVLTKDILLTLKRQFPDRSTRSIEGHWYRVLRKEWLENKRKEAEAKAEKPNGFWQRIINFIKPK